MNIKALPGKILVSDLERGERMVSGILIPNDNGKSSGIRPRWGKVYSIGDNVYDLSVGQWVLIESGRWTRMLEVKDADNTVQLWAIDPDSLLLVSDTDPESITFSK